jgi:hypothetical protein
MKYTLLLMSFLVSIVTFGQSYPLPTPELAYITEFKFVLDPAHTVGQTPTGFRRIVPIVDGTASGPKLNGKVLAGGSDWQLIRKDGTAEIEALSQMVTEDGVILYLKNESIRVAKPEVAARLAKGEVVLASEYYFKGRLKIEAPEGKYYWMNNAVFICQGVKNPKDVSLFVWQVL